MSNFTDFISSGGGGGGLPVNIVLTSSQTWVPPVDGNICIHVIGGGGGGVGTTGTPYSGGAGGYCKKNSLAVTTSGSFTVVVGAKGLGGDGGLGITGGNSTVAGTGLSATLTANGGSRATTSSDGAGGTASNGDVNNTGGAGNGSNEGGGGAVGIYGTGNSTYSRFKRGGESDAQAEGLESLSGYGYLVGGKAGKVTQRSSNFNSVNMPQYVEMDAGPLSGGAVFKDRSGNTDTWQKGGDGGIGGGGGGCRMSGDSTRAIGGDGGSGCVIIQYLPA